MSSVSESEILYVLDKTSTGESLRCRSQRLKAFFFEIFLALLCIIFLSFWEPIDWCRFLLYFTSRYLNIDACMSINVYAAQADFSFLRVRLDQNLHSICKRS
ncbi:uncharacterized protein K441DRAFT_9887 [Cenococcum geophilum 1.58]|uniref:uncharacterized protein n=1 Tax=Cenococcum geophilum 1.58 TaxID=794803 RepID=UPI00358EE17A|nr:hypothetical protein K441DRAFT_9887 [Cenococcum geophilum 1.58]